MKRIYNGEKLSGGDSFSWSSTNKPEELVGFYKTQCATRVFVHDTLDHEAAMDGYGTPPVDLPYVIHLSNGNCGLTGSNTIRIVLNNETYTVPEIGFSSGRGSFTFSIHHNRTAKTAAHV
jgi:hypothetical protein